MNPTQRIGIIGGSFDPVHNGHLTIALDALEQFELDRILFVPAHQAPLKSKAPAATPEQRLALLQAAIAGEPRFEISEADYRNPGISYSYRTAQTLASEHPDAALHWIIGGDQLAQLHHWRNIAELSRIVSFIVFERPGSSAPADASLPPHTQLHRAAARQLDISSTEIRQRLADGRSPKYFLPEAVFSYINAKNLYPRASVDL